MKKTTAAVFAAALMLTTSAAFAYNLRRKMAINSTSINYIQTLVGYGYKFLAP